MNNSKLDTALFILMIWLMIVVIAYPDKKDEDRTISIEDSSQSLSPSGSMSGTIG